MPPADDLAAEGDRLHAAAWPRTRSFVWWQDNWPAIAAALRERVQKETAEADATAERLIADDVLDVIDADADRRFIDGYIAADNGLDLEEALAADRAERAAHAAAVEARHD